MNDRTILPRRRRVNGVPMRTYPNSITLTSVMIEVRDRIKSGFDPVSALSTVSDGVLNWSKHEKEEE